MENQTYEEAVLKTVMWWSEKSFRTLFNQNNGDDSPQGGMAFMLMNMVSSKAQEKVTDEKIKLFEQKLTELLMAEKDNAGHRARLDVDYHPNQTLGDACKFAGIDSMCLPCKTYSFIDQNNKAIVKYQYGSSGVEI